MRPLLTIIGYLCTGTVLALCLGIGYLWYADMLNDDKMFRIVALVHDVDVDKIAAETEIDDSKVPSEEPSLDEVERYREVMLRNYEVKHESLARGKQEFEHLLTQLRESTQRFDELARDLGDQLKQQGELTTKENVSKVVRDLELMPADRSQEMLMRYMNEPEGYNDVIMLMGKMSSSKLKKVLDEFTTQEELDQLHKVHSLMLDGHPQKPIIDKAMQMLKSGEVGAP
jgi:hypothetical protein